MNPRSLSRRRHAGLLAICFVAPALLIASEARSAPPKPDGDPDQTTQSEASRILPALDLRVREAVEHARAFVSERLSHGLFTSRTRP